MAPETYTHGHHASVLRSHTWRTIANSAAYVEPHLYEGQRVLDVGCGPGTITAEFSERVGKTGHVVGLDSSDEVIDLATKSRIAVNVEFKVGSVYAMEYEDNSFDIVHAHQLLQHLNDPVAALREMRRVCRPDGLVAARDSDYSAMAWYPPTAELDDWLSVYRQIARSNGGEPDAGRRLFSWTRQAGFTDVTPSASVWCFATREECDWWSDLWAERVLESLVDQALSLAIATRADLQRIADGWRTWARDPDAWFTVLHGEILARP